jgi:hypothetical protein
MPATPGFLAVEHRERRRKARTMVHDVVDQTPGEDEHIPFTQALLELLPLCVNEANHHIVTMNEHHFRRSRVVVRNHRLERCRSVPRTGQVC